MKKTAKEILATLKKLYPNLQSELVFTNSYQLIVAVILSAQCTDKKVNQITPKLFKKYSGFEQLGKAKLEELREIIRPINYYRTKANHLKAMAMLIAENNNNLPTSIDELIKLPGVGRKTASVVAGELGHDFTLPVDTHVFRVSKRLGLTKGKNPLEVEHDLRKQYPKEAWRDLHHGLILHGRKVCKARNPICADCGLSKICPAAFKEN